MGLDMFAYITRAEIPPVDFERTENSTQLFYWRKHPNLHGWMEKLYRSKGGTDAEFNCVAVRLELPDIDALERAVGADGLPFITGFFFGESGPEDKQADLEFIRKARVALKDGLKVFYTSWW